MESQQTEEYINSLPSDHADYIKYTEESLNQATPAGPESNTQNANHQILSTSEFPDGIDRRHAPPTDDEDTNRCYGQLHVEFTNGVTSISSACLIRHEYDATNKDFKKVFGAYSLLGCTHSFVKHNNHKKRVYPKKATFFLEKQGGDLGIPIGIKDIWICKQYDPNNVMSGGDIAFMSIEWRPQSTPSQCNDGEGLKFPNGKIIPYIPVYVPSYSYGISIGIYGYPGELKAERFPPRGMQINFENDDEEEDYFKKNRKGNCLIYTKIQTTTGQSGAPLYADGGLVVFGVHNAGDGEENCGTINVPFKIENFQHIFIDGKPIKE